MFTITIILTKLGYENIEQVLSAVFRWVAYEFETICSQTSSVQIRGSVLDPYSMAFWIQIQIGMSNTDPDPGSVQLSGQFCPMQQLWSTFLKFNRLLIFLASKLNSDPYAILMLDTDRVFHIDRKGWSQGTWLMDLRSGVHRPVICSSYYLIITSKEVWGTIKFNKTFSCVAPGAYITDCRTYLLLQRILQVFFAYTSYLEMLQKAGPSERIFKEIQKIEILDFEHRDEKHPMDNVENLCENMHFYPPERYLGRVCLASWLVCVPSCG